MFKCAKKLEMRGYLKFVVNESNNKYTELTVKGKDYCKKSTELKEQMEREIAEVLGKDKVEALKDLLSRDWSIK